MTTPAPNQYMVTKNTKFEAKLARYLISKPGDQLLGYDACIEKIGRSIKYRLIVVGLESIYLPDNPPKIAQLKEPYLTYSDIIRAEMIDDYPEFLFGDEKLNTLHMRLRVMKSLKNSNKEKRKKVKPPSADEMETIPSLFDRSTLENINDYMERISPRQTNMNSDTYQAPLSQLYAAIPLLLSPSSSQTLTASSPRALNESDPFHLPLHQLDELSSTTMTNTSVGFRERFDQLNLNSERSSLQRLFLTRRTLSDDQKTTARSKSARSSSSKKSSNADSDWSSDTPRLNRYMLQKHEDDRFGVLHTPRTPRRALGRNQDDDGFMSTSRSTMSYFSLGSATNLNVVDNDNSSVYCPSIEEVRSLREDAEEMKDIDIYLLSLNSKIPEILSAALSNYVVVSTLRYDGKQPLSPIPTSDRPCDSIEKTMNKFSDLKYEILQSRDDRKELYKLTNELYSACDKYTQIKELFWKDQDLFSIFVSQFHSCSQAILNNKYDKLTMNLSFSIMQLLSEAFLNTFASNERRARLTSDQCSRLKLLIQCLLAPPISLLETEPTLNGQDLDEAIKDTYKAVLRWMFLSTSLLWQIADILVRPSWTSEHFRYQHFIEIFEKKQDKDEYFDLFIDALYKLTGSNENIDPLSPKHALYVYQVFSIYSILLINSKFYSEYFHDRYTEEFRYFLKKSDILSRIPVQYPVYRFIPELIDDVHYRILHGESNRNISNRIKNRQLI